MTKDVLITIKGLQSLGEAADTEEVELVAKGDYYFKNGHHYIFFDYFLLQTNNSDLYLHSLKTQKYL